MKYQERERQNPENIKRNLKKLDEYGERCTEAQKKIAATADLCSSCKYFFDYSKNEKPKWAGEENFKEWDGACFYLPSGMNHCDCVHPPVYMKNVEFCSKWERDKAV